MADDLTEAAPEYRAATEASKPSPRRRRNSLLVVQQPYFASFFRRGAC
jgi:hypothetical protein